MSDPPDSKPAGEAQPPAAARSHPNDPLHGLTLKDILTQLHARYGWEGLGKALDIRCFTHDPSMGSSLTFLRRQPWARQAVEALYLRSREEEGPELPVTTDGA